MIKSPKLSIIIPAYNEEKNIFRTVNAIIEVQKALDYDFEVIVVVDGSPDRTADEAKRVNSPYVKVLEYSPNRGKGYAIKYGVKNSAGSVITFTDAGGDFPPGQFDKYLKLLELFDADIVIGSKRHPASKVNYPFKRRFFSYTYHLLVRLLFGLRVTDTQAGLKFLKREVAMDVIPKVVVEQYAFDLELLIIAFQRGHKRIFEAPVELNFNSLTSSISAKAIRTMLSDTLNIFYRARILNHYRRQSE